MGKIIKWIIIIVLAVILYKAYNASQKNGRSIINNAGKESKALFEQSQQKAKAITDEFKSGMDEE